MQLSFKNIQWVLGLALIFLSGCTSDTLEDLPMPITEKDYIFLGHIYEDNTQVDFRVQALDLSPYDQIWLGGDICAETTADIETLYHIDSLFDLSDPTTHWTLGNHDIRNGNVDWIEDIKERPTFYTDHFDGITLLVLNTTFSQFGDYDTLNVKAQYELIETVCDTISSSSHLVVLTHHAVWNLADQVNDIGDYSNGDFSFYRFNFDPELTYFTGVYPLLTMVEQRGVEVIHIAGDFGQEASTYNYLSPEGVQFLGSGITSNTLWNSQFPTAGIPDSILLLKHNLLEKTIDWTFEQLD